MYHSDRPLNGQRASLAMTQPGEYDRIGGHFRVTSILLFDIDGTLLRAGDPTHGRAVTVACQHVFGVEGELARTDLAGRTDRRILEQLLATYGVPAGTIAAGLNEAFTVMSDFVDANLPPSLSDRLLPGVVEALEAAHEAGHVVGLVTGNLPRIAAAKLSRAGIWPYFTRHDAVIGGFGDISALRADLVMAALATAGAHLGYPALGQATVIIGDTPHDIDCGVACDTRTVGVATGRFSAEQLRAAGADLVLEDLSQTTSLLEFVSPAFVTGTGAPEQT